MLTESCLLSPAWQSVRLWAANPLSDDHRQRAETPPLHTSRITTLNENNKWELQIANSHFFGGRSAARWASTYSSDGFPFFSDPSLKLAPLSSSWLRNQLNASVFAPPPPLTSSLHHHPPNPPITTMEGVGFGGTSPSLWPTLNYLDTQKLGGNDFQPECKSDFTCIKNLRFAYSCFLVSIALFCNYRGGVGGWGVGGSVR